MTPLAESKVRFKNDFMSDHKESAYQKVERVSKIAKSAPRMNEYTSFEEKSVEDSLGKSPKNVTPQKSSEQDD